MNNVFSSIDMSDLGKISSRVSHSREIGAVDVHT